jgi:hypothetical protein
MAFRFETHLIAGFFGAQYLLILDEFLLHEEKVFYSLQFKLPKLAFCPREN